MDIDRDLAALEEDHDLDPVARLERLRDILQGLDPSDPRHQALLSEWAAWALQPTPGDPGSATRGGWFGPLAAREHEDGRREEVPDPGLFSAEALEHLTSRAESTTNPEVAARFADVLWDRRTRNHTLARRAFENYVLLVRRGLVRPDAGGGHNPTLIVTYARRAAVLALQLHDARMLSDVAALYHEVLAGAPGDVIGFGLAQRLIEDGIPLVRRGALASQDLLDVADRLYARAAEGDTKEAACGTMARLLTALGRPDDAKAWRLKGAESLESHGDFFASNGPEAALIAQSWYQKAAQAYVDLGAGQERIERVKRKLAEAGMQGLGNMKELSASVSIPREEIDKIIARVTSLPNDQAILAIAHSTWGIPDLDAVRTLISQLLRQSPITALATRVLIDDDGLPHQLPEEEVPKYELVQHIVRGLHMLQQLLLGPIFAALRQQSALGVDDIMGALARSRSFTDHRLTLVKAGVATYLQDDHISSIHVLVPQVEGMVRDLAGAFGLPTTALKEGGSRVVPRSLDELLAEPRLREVFGEGFSAQLEAVYTDPMGWRLRHRLAHGNLKDPSVFIRPMTEIILYTILQVAKCRITPTTAEEPH